MTRLLEPDRCPGLFYGTPAQDGYLIRIRTPGGLLSARQGEAIAAIAQQWHCDSLQVTNRANLQLRARRELPTTGMLQTLQAVGLAAQHPPTDRLRNLMASPTAGLDPQEHIDTRPLIQALDAYIQTAPALSKLPSKFSIGIDGGGAVGIGTRSVNAWEHRYNEIQLTAIAPPAAGSERDRFAANAPAPDARFHLTFAASQQTIDTGIAIAAPDCLAVLKALIAIYLEYAHQAAPWREKPRLKYLLQDWGLDDYLQRLSQRLDYALPRRPEYFTSPPAQPGAHLGYHPQRQAGFVYVGVSLPLGHLTPNQLLGLVALSQCFGDGQLRLTPWQSLVLPNIPKSQVPDIQLNLAELGLHASDRPIRAAMAACAGKPGCQMSATQTQQHAIALTAHLQQRLSLDRPVNIHFTGCPKACAQPSPAEILLLGTVVEQHGRPVEGYQIYLCGDERQPLLPAAIPFGELPSLIEHLLQLYLAQRQSSQESFGRFASRCGIEPLRQQLQSPLVALS